MHESMEHPAIAPFLDCLEKTEMIPSVPPVPNTDLPDGLDPLATVPDEATAISRRVARDETLAAVLARLEDLEEPDRSLLVHRGLEERPHEEVADLLGLEHGVARKRWQRLVGRLAEDPRLGALALDLD